MYTARYFDGQTARAHTAQIALESGRIAIHYTSESGTPLTVYWQIVGISPGQHIRNTKTTLKYGDYPHQYIEVDDLAFYDALTSSYPDHRFSEPQYEFLRSRGFRGILWLTFGLVVVAVLSYLYALPALAEYLAGRMPVETEEQIGEKMYEQMIGGYSIDQPMTKKANEFWRELHINSPYPVNITVVDEDIPNAFALPGGRIIIYNGILHRMTDYGELVALLGHEYTHVAGKHTTRMLYRNLSSYLFVSLLLGDASGIIVTLAANANSLKQLGFNRELEHQADVGGYEIMQARHISPDGMLRLFETLKKAETDIAVPRFLSTHPLTDERIDYIHSRLVKDTTVYTVSHFDLQHIWEEMKGE